MTTPSSWILQPQNLFLSAKARIGLLSRVDDLDAVRLKFNPAPEILRIYDSKRRELYFSQDRTSKILFEFLLPGAVKNIRLNPDRTVPGKFHVIKG